MIAVLLAFWALLAVQAQGTWKALDPEQMRYVYKRCYEDHLPIGPARDVYTNSWNKWKLEPDNNVTHCYVKCVLMGMGIYDDKDKKFKGERITIQHNAFKKYNGANSKQVTAFDQAVSKLNAKTGTCGDVFKAYKTLHERFLPVTRQLYHGSAEGAARVYASMPNVKRKGESYVTFCQKRAWKGKNKRDMERSRRFELTDSKQLREAIDCIFRGFRYLTDDGLNVDEIVRDFALINKSSLEPKVRSVLKDCGGTVAYDYYSCLLKSPIKKQFMNAFDFRELRSVDYSYLLNGNVYEGPKKVKEELQKLNTMCT